MVLVTFPLVSGGKIIAVVHHHCTVISETLPTSGSGLELDHETGYRHLQALIPGYFCSSESATEEQQQRQANK